MTPRTRHIIGQLRLPLVAVAVAVMWTAASADLNQDKAECADQLVGLATCLPYVGGDAKAPTVDCCGGLKQVLDKSKKCICVLIRDRDDPNLGFKINATLALGLPAACHNPINITECIDILHLDPKSTEAKIFEGSSKGNSSSTPSPSTKAPTIADVNSTSNGTASTSTPPNGSSRRSGNIGLVLGITCGAVLWLFFTSNLMFYYV